MGYDEYQAAMAIVRLQAEVRELRAGLGRAREELREALERGDRLAAENQRLQQHIGELERTSARQAAPFRRREAKKLPSQAKKRPGRKPGHPGSYRPVPDHVDQEVVVPLSCCPQCGGEVEDRSPLLQYIEELPPVRPHVTRLTTYTGVCSCCGEVRSTHPLQTSTGQGAAQVQLGPRALALAALLNKQLGLPMRKTCRVLRQLGGLSLTPGGLSQALGRMSSKVSGDYEQLVERLRGSPAVFADETSWWVGGPGWWLWVFTTPEGVTFYQVDQGRGSAVVKQVLGDEFAGTLTSDCLSSYDPVPYKKHKCIAHHLRAIKQARDRPDTLDAGYLDEWTALFQRVIEVYDQRPDVAEEEFARRRAELSAWVDQLLNRTCTQSGDVAVQKRLLKQWAHLLGCLDNPAAEPTNNRAERALRPAVIARKLSCGNKTDAGRICWQTLASLAATCDGLKQDFVDLLAQRLQLSVQAG